MKGQARYDDVAEFRPNWFCVYCFFLWLAIHGAALAAFIIDNERLTEDSADIQLWRKNMDTLCNGRLNFANSFQYRMFKYISMCTFHLWAFMFFVQRKRIGLLLCYSVKLQDGMSFKHSKPSTVTKQIIIRIVVGIMLLGEFLMCQKGASFFKGDDIKPSVGFQLFYMVLYMTWPCLVSAYIISSGIYDLKI